VQSVQIAHALHRAVLLVISRSGMSSHWRLIISKRRFVPVARRAVTPAPRRSTHPAVTHRGPSRCASWPGCRFAPGVPIGVRKVTAHQVRNAAHYPGRSLHTQGHPKILSNRSAKTLRRKHLRGPPLRAESLRTLRPETNGQAGACPDRTRAIPCTVRAVTPHRRRAISVQLARVMSGQSRVLGPAKIAGQQGLQAMICPISKLTVATGTSCPPCSG
jgi:hypothetical protein